MTTLLDYPCPCFLFEENDLRQFFMPKSNDSHKGNRGYVAIIAGSLRYSGASKLSNLAACACRSGAGVVKLAVPESIKNAVMPQLLDSTLFPLKCGKNLNFIFKKTQAKDLISKCKCVSCGMGMGHSKELIKLVRFLLFNYDGILILDADATWAYANLYKTKKFKKQIHFNKRKCQLILTPHLGEFSTLTGYDISSIKQNKESILLDFCKKNQCITLLKGAKTKVCDGQKIYLSDSGCSGMAKAGSGDVLSGILSAVLASNYSSICYDNNKLAQCVCSCAYINGKAGELNCKSNNEFTMLSSETPNYLRCYLNKLLASF